MKRAALGVAWIAAILGLIALGSWQVQRLAWKRALIAQVDARLKAAPAPAPATAGPEDAYRRVTVTGHFLLGKDSFVQASTMRGPGWWVLTPLQIARPQPGAGRGPVAERQLASDAQRDSRHRDWAPASAGVGAGDGEQPQAILINRGYVTERRAPPVDTQPVIITGLLRLTEPGGGFLRANDPQADRWYSRDVAAIAAKRGVAAAPYFIDADAASSVPGGPIGGLTVVRFPNNHLPYAITWYILAIMATAGFIYWIRIDRRVP